QCFGFGLATQRLMHFDEPYASYPQQPGEPFASPWYLQNEGAASSPIAHYIHNMHLEQLSTEFLTHWLGEVLANIAAGPTAGTRIYNQVHAALLGGDHPSISLQQGGTGHVVVAYDLQNTGGGFDIYIYDPNRPFRTTENSDAVDHMNQENRSVIHVAS